MEGGKYVVRLLDLDRQTDRVLELPGSNWKKKSHELLYVRGQDIIAAAWRVDAGRFKLGPERVWAHLATNTPLGILDAGPDGRVLIAVPKGATLAP